MKKGEKFIFLGIVLIIALLSVSMISALSPRKPVIDCNKKCTSERTAMTKICNSEHKSCREICNSEKESCLDIIEQTFDLCRGSCYNSSSNSKDRECNRLCSFARIELKKTCAKQDCLNECRTEKKTCNDNIKNSTANCKAACEAESAGLITNKEECESSGGLFYKLCNGPYFDIVCTQDEFCICSGKSNYTCPQNYICDKKIKDFLPRKTNTISGYRDLSGNLLGDIGVCRKEN